MADLRISGLTKVFGTGEGTFAEYAVADEKSLAVKPAGLTFEQATALPNAAFWFINPAGIVFGAGAVGHQRHEHALGERTDGHGHQG